MPLFHDRTPEVHRLTDFDDPDSVTWVGPARGSMTTTLTAKGRAHLDLQTNEAPEIGG